MKWMGWAALLPWLMAPAFAQTPAAQEAGETVAEVSGTASAERSAKVTRLVDLSTEVEPARPELIPTSQFAGHSVFRSAQLSPDGINLAFIREFPLFAAVTVASPDDSADTGRNFFLPKGFDPLSFSWAGNQRLIVDGVGIHSTERYRYRVRRLFLVDLTDGEIHLLIEDPFVSSYADVIGVAKDGTYAMIAHAEDPGDYDENEPAVFRYDLEDGIKVWLAQSAVKGVSDWRVDDGGTVRLGFGLDGDTVNVWYRAEPDGELQQIRAVDRDDADSLGSTLRMVSGSSRAHVLRSVDGAPVGLHLYDYASGEIVETLYQNEEWDVEDVWFRDGEPVAIAFTDDAERIVWLDEADGGLYEQLHAALGGGLLRLVVTSRSHDNDRMLVWAGDEADPGVLYLFDQTKRDLKVLAAMRPDLDFEQLARPQPMAYTARDGTLIRGYLTLPRGREPNGLPLVIMPHGGPYGIRDTLSYNDEVQLLANRGYAVLQPNFRGSGGYGEAFFELGTGEIGRGMQDDLDDAMDWAVREGIADPARVCVVGGSYGGYAALWAVLRNPERYRCAASWAGVTDWERILKYDRKFFSREGRRRWRARVEGEDGFDLDSVSPFRLAERLNRPVLLAHGTRDSVVPFSQFEDMVEASEDAAIPPTQLIIHGSGHSFTKPRDEKIWYDALDAFLAEHNPADQLDNAGKWVPPVDPAQELRFIPLEIGASATGDAGDTGEAVPTDQGDEQGATGGLPIGEPSS